MHKRLKVLVVGCGRMGTLHARAYHQLKEDFQVVGLVNRGPSNRQALAKELGNILQFEDFRKGLKETQPDVVCICTYPNSHEEYSLLALNANCHVFVEKPMADTVKGAEKIAALAKKKNLKVVVGYILRVHPVWIRFVELVKELGSPLIMRLNLIRQSQGELWNIHKNLLKSVSPLVDSGVHYVDVMCQMTGTRPIRVQAMGTRVSKDIPNAQNNYGGMEIEFEDGSIGWFEAGWGPMWGTAQPLLREATGPKGSVTLLSKSAENTTKDLYPNRPHHDLVVHNIPSKLLPRGRDERISLDQEPNQNQLCLWEQKYFLKAIRQNTDLNTHLQNSIQSLKVVLAAEESIRKKKSIRL